MRTLHGGHHQRSMENLLWVVSSHVQHRHAPPTSYDQKHTTDQTEPARTDEVRSCTKLQLGRARSPVTIDVWSNIVALVSGVIWNDQAMYSPWEGATVGAVALSFLQPRLARPKRVARLPYFNFLLPTSIASSNVRHDQVTYQWRR